MQFSAPIHVLKRKARLASRADKIPLHQALDQIARAEGFRNWGHLSAQAKPGLLSRLAPGDLVLLAARPGQGKTLLGLELAAEAAAKGHPVWVFTLDYTTLDVARRYEELGIAPAAIRVDTSDEICADYIIGRTAPAHGAVIVIDYLQLLDQRRSNPALQEQVNNLKSFAQSEGATVIAISQVDRAFDLSGRSMPELSDIRMPNPIDLTAFDKRCFLHRGDIHFDAA